MADAGHPYDVQFQKYLGVISDCLRSYDILSTCFVPSLGVPGSTASILWATEERAGMERHNIIVFLQRVRNVLDSLRSLSTLSACSVPNLGFGEATARMLSITVAMATGV